MKLLSKLLFIGASLIGSVAYAGCNTGDSNPVECDSTVNLGSVTGYPVTACIPANAKIGIPSQVCVPISPPNAGAFSYTVFYASSKGSIAYNNYINFTGTYTGTCAPTWAQGLPCVNSTNTTVTTVPSTVPSVPSFAPGNWGTSTATIFAQFPATQVANFAANTTLNAAITNMDHVMLARLTLELKRLDSSGQSTAALLTSAGKMLSAQNLAYLTSAFGPAAMTSALAAAPASVLQAYNAITPLPPTPGSAYAVSLGLPALWTDANQDMYDVFLDAYTSDVDATTMHSAQRAAAYYQARVKNIVIEVVIVSAAVIGLINAYDPMAFHNMVDTLAGWVVSFGSHIPDPPPMFPNAIIIPDLTLIAPSIDPDLIQIPDLNFSSDTFCTAETDEPELC